MHTIVIDGVIGWDITGRKIRDELAKADGQDVRVEIASPGGFVFDGIEIFNLFKNYSGKVHMHIIGLAASMASYIPLAGDSISAEENAVFMIHNVWSLAIGDYRDMEKESKIIKGLTDILAKAYSAKTGKSVQDMQALMDAETYFFGKEIIDNGFVDELVSVDKKLDSKDEALAFARLQVEDCFSKLEKTGKKDDIQKAAAFLTPKVFGKKQSDNNKTIPAEAGNKNKEGSKAMNLDQLKSEHPDLYNSVMQAGIDKEKKRILAHLKAGKRSGAMEAALKFIEEDKSFLDEDVQAEYLTAGMNKNDLKDRLADNPDNLKIPENDQAAKEDGIMAKVEAGLGIPGGKE